jgi:hypothetical protein
MEDRTLADFQADEHDPKCSRPQEEVGFGVAGGGYAYGYCPECGAMLWKSEELEDG